MESRKFAKKESTKPKRDEKASKGNLYLYFHAEDKRSSTGGVLSRLKGLRNRTDVTFEAPLRGWNSAVALVGDDVFLVGSHPATNDVPVVNSLNGHVSRATPMAEKRIAPSAVGSPDGRGLLVFGGRNESDEYLSYCESFDLSTTRWTPLPALPTPRSHTSAFHVPGKGFVVAGGWDGRNESRVVEVLAEDAHLWHRLEPMLEGRQRPGVAVFRRRLVMAGGFCKTSVECLSLDTAGLHQWTHLAGFEGNRRSNGLGWHSLVSLGKKTDFVRSGRILPRVFCSDFDFERGANRNLFLEGPFPH